MPNTHVSQEQKISSLVNCRIFFYQPFALKLHVVMCVCVVFFFFFFFFFNFIFFFFFFFFFHFQFDLIQVMDPFVHTLSHNKI